MFFEVMAQTNGHLSLGMVESREDIVTLPRNDVKIYCTSVRRIPPWYYPTSAGKWGTTTK